MGSTTPFSSGMIKGMNFECSGVMEGVCRDICRGSKKSEFVETVRGFVNLFLECSEEIV